MFAEVEDGLDVVEPPWPPVTAFTIVLRVFDCDEPVEVPDGDAVPEVLAEEVAVEVGVVVWPLVVVPEVVPPLVVVVLVGVGVGLVGVGVGITVRMCFMKAIVNFVPSVRVVKVLAITWLSVVVEVAVSATDDGLKRVKTGR